MDPSPTQPTLKATDHETASAGSAPRLDRSDTNGPPPPILEAPIGRGGIGIVYRARQIFSSGKTRVVALKTLRDHKPDKGTLEGFEREIRKMLEISQMGFQGFVDVYDDGKLDGKPYFLMRYLEHHQTLSAYLEAANLSWREKIRLFQRVCRVLNPIHDRSEPMVHRDLKPANIMVDPQGAPVILDFGLCVTPSASEDLLTFNALRRDIPQAQLADYAAPRGTLPYMAPEQTFSDKFHELSPRADVYALGVILYEMLTGERPYSATSTDWSRSPQDVIQTIRETPPRTKPSACDPDIPPAMDEAALEALAKDPASRPATAGEFADRLDNILKPPDPWRRLPEPSTRSIEPEAGPSPAVSLEIEESAPPNDDNPRKRSRIAYAVWLPAVLAGFALPLGWHQFSNPAPEPPAIPPVVKTPSQPDFSSVDSSIWDWPSTNAPLPDSLKPAYEIAAGDLRKEYDLVNSAALLAHWPAGLQAHSSGTFRWGLEAKGELKSKPMRPGDHHLLYIPSGEPFLVEWSFDEGREIIRKTIRLPKKQIAYRPLTQ